MQITNSHSLARGWTERRQALFLDRLLRTGDVRQAAEACGLSRQSVYKLRHRDLLFVRKWDDAVDRFRSRQAEACAAIAADFQRRAGDGAPAGLSPWTV